LRGRCRRAEDRAVHAREREQMPAAVDDREFIGTSIPAAYARARSIIPCASSRVMVIRRLPSDDGGADALRANREAAAAADRFACAMIASRMYGPSRAWVRIEHLLSQSIGHRTASRPASMTRLVGEVRQETAAFGETVARMQRDGLPNAVDIGIRNTVLPQHRSGEVGSLDSKRACPRARSPSPRSSSRSPRTASPRRRPRRSAALTVGKQAREEEGPDAVATIGGLSVARASARLASTSGPVGSARMSSIPKT